MDPDLRNCKILDCSLDKPLKKLTLASVLCDVCGIELMLKDFDEKLSGLLKIVLNYEKTHYDEYLMNNDDFLFMKEVQEKLMEKVQSRTLKGSNIGLVLKAHEDICKLLSQWISLVKQIQIDHRFTGFLRSKVGSKRACPPLSSNSESDFEAERHDTSRASNPESLSCTNAQKLNENRKQQQPAAKERALTKEFKFSSHDLSLLDVTDRNEVSMDLHDTYQEEKVCDPSESPNALHAGFKENTRSGGTQMQTEQSIQNVSLTTGKKDQLDELKDKDESRILYAENEANLRQPIEMKNQPASGVYQTETLNFDDEDSEDHMPDVESYSSFSDVNLTFLSDSGRIDLNNNMSLISSESDTKYRSGPEGNLKEFSENCTKARQKFCPNVEFWKNIEY